MQFRIFKNLVVNDSVEGDPQNVKIDPNSLAAMKAVPKKRRRQLLMTKTAEWCIYSPFTGVIPGQRINKETNPPLTQCNFSADYDVPVAPEQIEGYLSKLDPALHPTAFDVTLSGNLRPSFNFESLVRFANFAHASQFQKELSDLLKLPTLFPGYDTASESPTQVWTLGDGLTQWKAGNTLPTTVLEGLCVKAFKKSHTSTSTGVGFDLIAEECEKRFPGMWRGEFKIGATGVRFWDPKADNPRGAMLMEGGVFCFTGDRTWIPYSDEAILGHDWSAKQNVLHFGNATEDIYFDDRNYWRLLPDGIWVASVGKNIELELKSRGVRAKAAKGELMSEMEEVLYYIQTNKRVAAAIPLVFIKPGITSLDGERVLNISTVKALPPIEVEGMKSWK